MHSPASEARFLFSMLGTSLEAPVVHIWASEAISACFEVQITLASVFEIKSFDEVIGKEALLTIANDDSITIGMDRYFHGVVRRFEHTGSNGKYLLYEAEVVPTFWQLNLRSNCRIFQEMQVQDIIKKILEEGGITSDRYRFALTNKDRLRGFCVQYRETDFDFVTRLLEEEGMFYFFEHRHDKHVLVIADDSIVHLPLEGKPSITFNHGGGMVPEKESIQAFSFSQRLRPGAFTHTNYNFKKPSFDLTTRQTGTNPEKFEVYDYSTPYVLPNRGNVLAKARMEELVTRQRQGHGHSSSCRLIPGYKFTLTDHFSRSLNGDYLIINVIHSGEQSQALEEQAGGKCSYDNQFTVIPASVQFRPRITREKPYVRGLQTAIVVGPQGEEIHTDEYGRVKVQFHWDREGRRNENSSCWLRYGQLWGGGGWGTVFIPRVGDEVLVDFIEGDPARPIIVGSVYNGANQPLYELPASKTMSTIKTRSYPNGGRDNYHELRFDDRKGAEEIYLQSEKDWNILVKNDKGQTVGRDESLTVGNNRSKTVGVNQSESIGVDKTIQVGANHNETIGANMTLSVGGFKNERVGINSLEMIGGAKELAIGGLYQVAVGGVMNETVAGAKTEEVGLAKAVFVGNNMSENVKGDRTTNTDGNYTETTSARYYAKANEYVIEATKITLKAGSSTIVMDRSSITIKASKVFTN